MEGSESAPRRSEQEIQESFPYTPPVFPFPANLASVRRFARFPNTDCVSPRVSLYRLVCTPHRLPHTPAPPSRERRRGRTGGVGFPPKVLFLKNSFVSLVGWLDDRFPCPLCGGGLSLDERWRRTYLRRGVRVKPEEKNRAQRQERCSKGTINNQGSRGGIARAPLQGLLLSAPSPGP